MKIKSFTLGLVCLACVVFSLQATSEQSESMSEESNALKHMDEITNSDPVPSTGVELPTPTEVRTLRFGSWEPGQEVGPTDTAKAQKTQAKIGAVKEETKRWRDSRIKSPEEIKALETQVSEEETIRRLRDQIQKKESESEVEKRTSQSQLPVKSTNPDSNPKNQPSVSDLTNKVDKFVESIAPWINNWEAMIIVVIVIVAFQYAKRKGNTVQK